MEEKEKIKRKITNHLVYNIIGFSTIFILFGIVIFLMIRSIVYNKIDEELMNSKKKIYEIQKTNFDIVYKNNSFNYIQIDDLIKDIINNSLDNVIAGRIENPDVLVIIRDIETEKVLNKDMVGRLTSYIDELTFNPKILDKIYESSIEGKYYYKCINFVYDGDDLPESRYIQLLINIDNEKNLVSNCSKIVLTFISLFSPL